LSGRLVNATRPSSKIPRPGVPDEGHRQILQVDHGNLVRGLVADRAATPLTQRMMYRVGDLASEMFEPDSGKWVPHDKLF
jgi:hypothetical protein